MPDDDFVGYDLSFKTGVLHFPESLFFQSRASAGDSMVARIPMTAITTKSSIKVNLYGSFHLTRVYAYRE
jgi:hypothetical protein